MVTGSERTPKGGLKALLAAHEGEDGTVVPPRTGQFGRGAYANEPWSLVAIRKRVTSVRKFYEHYLDGAKEEVNPGWQQIVKGTLASIGLLLGEGVLH
eukprot:7379864-Prymnesium_polylepis.1